MNNKIRFLGIDYGDKIIGLSISSECASFAVPLTFIQVNSMREAIDKAVSIIKEYEIGKIVVGLPINMDGSEGERASKTRSFAKVLEKVSGVEVDFFDERLTSLEADNYLSKVKRHHKKGKRDMSSATIILQDYLSSLCV